MLRCRIKSEGKINAPLMRTECEIRSLLYRSGKILGANLDAG